MQKIKQEKWKKRLNKKGLDKWDEERLNKKDKTRGQKIAAVFFVLCFCFGQAYFKISLLIKVPTSYKIRIS